MRSKTVDRLLKTIKPSTAQRVDEYIDNLLDPLRAERNHRNQQRKENYERILTTRPCGRDNKQRQK